MVKYIFYSIVLFTSFLSSCQDEKQYQIQQPSPVVDHGTHQVVTQPNGSQVVVVKDEKSGAEFFMEMMMFQSLMNMAGGMSNVNGYYNQHRYDSDWNQRQTSYRQNTTTVVNNYYNNNRSTSSKPNQVPSKQSSGFSSKQNTTSNGFTTKYTPVTTTTPASTYTQSKGFTSSTPTTKNTGFGKSSSRSTGFGG